MDSIPAKILNWIDGNECEALTSETFAKVSPVSCKERCRVVRSRAEDVQRAVQSARRAQPAWADSTPVHRGDLRRLAIHCCVPVAVDDSNVGTCGSSDECLWCSPS